jgi:hypothetical protein
MREEKDPDKWQSACVLLLPVGWKLHFKDFASGAFAHICVTASPSPGLVIPF